MLEYLEPLTLYKQTSTESFKNKTIYKLLYYKSYV